MSGVFCILVGMPGNADLTKFDVKEFAALFDDAPDRSAEA